MSSARKVVFSLLTAGIVVVASTWSVMARAEDAAAKKEPQIGRFYPSVEVGLSLTQGSFSKNWSGGDQGSLIWTLNTNSGLVNQLSPKVNWASTLKAAYGQTHQQKLGTDAQRHWDRPEKSTDLLDFETIFRLTLGGFVDPFVSGHFQSQFQDASDPMGRNLSLNPLIFDEAAGVARELVKQEDRQVLTRVGFSLGQNSRKNYIEAPPSRRTRSESSSSASLQWVTEAKAKVLEKRVTWSSKLIVTQPLQYSGKNTMRNALGRMSPVELAQAGIAPDAYKYTTTAGADWENIFTSQITKVISVNLYTRWVYDKYDNTVKPLAGADGKLSNAPAVQAAIRKAGQFKETISIGLTYRLL